MRICENSTSRECAETLITVLCVVVYNFCVVSDEREEIKRSVGRKNDNFKIEKKNESKYCQLLSVCYKNERYMFLMP